jgi:2-polyprenyl-3-methyl-5-hydroxy-6-metoxy-1,4-benzoquinol methylase
MGNQDNFKEFDFEGEENLRAIAEADKFNEWMYHQVLPHCEGKILEIGSGIGNISYFFDRDGKDIDLSDIRDQYRSYLKKTFEKRNVLDMDIVAEGFIELHGDKLGTYDAVFALNVVEHIKDDKLAIENMIKLLKPGGKVVILVPAYQWLYNGFDVALEHYKRYTKSRFLSFLTLQRAK